MKEIADKIDNYLKYYECLFNERYIYLNVIDLRFSIMKCLKDLKESITEVKD